MRWASPVIYMRRTLATDTVIGGQPMPQGDKVLLFYCAANRDARTSPDPDRFDVRRSPNPHVGFGGAGPALLPGRAPRPPGDHGDVPRAAHPRPGHPRRRRAGRLRSSFINGIKHMPVAFTPGGGAGGARIENRRKS